ncbi:MAG: ribosome maturation factor RimM [Gammaproteobacteria bacterium]|nr:MAG: ribosome maturation factor RimM [Gammaproteobacteria bacterium]
MAGADAVLVGRVVGLFGVRGWVRVESYTAPRENIGRYAPWELRLAARRARFEPRAVRAQGRGLVAALVGIDDRDAAASWLGAEIHVEAARLPPPAPGEYYWKDLIGLAVVNRSGERLGVVRRLLETGAHDVLVVDGEAGEYLIPFALGRTVDAVSLEEGWIAVDWQADWR